MSHLSCAIRVLALGAMIVWAGSLPAQLSPQETAQRIQKLIDQLGDPSYFIREQAQSELERYGYDAIDALTAAQSHDDLEVVKRTRYLLRNLKVEIVREDDPADVREVLKDYENADRGLRQERIRGLAELPGGMGVAALCRIIRFDRSPVLSKQAAVEVIETPVPEGAAWQHRARSMLESLGASLRPGADWIRTFVKSKENPADQVEAVRRITQTELSQLQNNSSATSREVVLALLDFESELLAGLGRKADARQTMIKMIELEEGEPRTLTKLVETLLAETNWPVLTQIAEKFQGRIDRHPRLLYRMAEAHLRMDEKAQAEKLAERAHALNSVDRTARFRLSYDLGTRGLWKWSEAERKSLLDLPPDGECDLSLPEDNPRVKKMLADYLLQDETERLDRLQSLAEFTPQNSLSALCRIVRFEHSEQLAKEAAISILKISEVDELAWQRWTKIIENVVGETDRPSVGWVRTFVLERDQPQQAVQAWPEFIRDEAKLAAEDDSGKAKFLAALRLRHFHLLRRLGDADQASDVLEQLVKECPADPGTVSELTNLLFGEQQWKLLSRLGETHAGSFQSQPLLLYCWALSAEKLGEQARSRQLADRAFGMQGQDMNEHWRVAYDLVKRGMFDWAMREYQFLIDNDRRGGVYALNAQFRLAELLHDQDDNLAAAKMLEEAEAAMRDNPESKGYLTGDPGFLPARMHFFYSEHFAEGANRNKQIEHLEKAIEHSPYDADALIALYRAPDQNQEQQKKIKQYIAKAVDHFRNQIQENAENSTPYNQLAWLISNTEGDLDEALRCSLKSLELRPGSAGYLDTLGRCYFARKEYKQAVKYQTMAVELDPHSVALRRQLKLFQEELARHQAEPAQTDDSAPSEASKS